MDFFSVLLSALSVLFPLMNPVGNTPIFYSITTADTPAYRRRQALKCAINVFVILAICLFLGRYILAMFGLSVSVLKLAGGLVVANVGWGLLQKSPQLDDQAHQEARDKVDISLSPMALPIMAGPGAMSVSIYLGTNSPHLTNNLINLLALALLTLLNYLCLILGEPLIKKLGQNGMNAFNKILGFLVLGIGLNLVISGLHELFSGVPTVH